MARVLPQEVVALIHHIELNKAGWYDKAIQRLVVASIWLAGKPLTLQQILQSLQEDFHLINIRAQRVKPLIAELCNSGILVSVQGNQFKISDSAQTNFEREISEANSVRQVAINKFKSLLSRHCSDLDPDEAWGEFDKFLQEMIGTIGASTYNLLSRDIDLQKVVGVNALLQRFPEEVRPLLLETVRTFLDPEDPAIRSFVLRSLNAYFMIEAISLGKNALDALSSAVKPTFMIFFDTNFLFSMLGLHENPANEAVLTLLRLISEVSDFVSISSFVLPITVDEAKSVLISARDSLKNMKLAPNLARAALKAGSISSVSRTYIARAAESVCPLDPKEHFDPYISNLIKILDARGVHLFEEDTSTYESNPEIQREIYDQLLFEYEREKSDKTKTAKTERELKHDIILWHFVKNKRPIRAESPVDARYWIVTIDYRFLGYDAYKRRLLYDALPICVHPTTLIQLLSFWIPRSPEFERALLSGIQLPLFFQEFDPSAEQVTFRILQILSKFENAKLFPEESVTSILVNNALRERLSAEVEESAQIELIRDALLSEYQKNVRRLEESVSKFEEQAKKKSEIVYQLEQELAEAKEDLTKTQEIVEALTARIDELERQRNEQAKKQREDALKRSAHNRLILLGLFFVALEGIGTCLAWKYGAGENLLQKVTDQWPFLGIIIPLVIIFLSWFFLGKERIVALGWPFTKLFKSD